jgi:hypothetical protein
MYMRRMRDEMSSIRARWIFAALVAATAVLAHCQASADDQRLDGDFAKRMFAGSASKPKAYACFIRRYDAEHLAQHVAEKGTDDKMLEYSFRLGVNFRHCPGDFDSSGECGHAPTVRAQNSDTDLPFTTRIDFNCDVDCDGGGIAVNLANNDGSMIVKLDRIRIWKGNSPDEKAATGLQGGADDKVFRLDRTNLSECTPFVADRKELAAMRHK